MIAWTSRTTVTLQFGDTILLVMVLAAAVLSVATVEASASLLCDGNGGSGEATPVQLWHAVCRRGCRAFAGEMRQTGKGAGVWGCSWFAVPVRVWQDKQGTREH